MQGDLISDWLDAAVQGLGEISSTSLGIKATAMPAMGPSAISATSASWVALVGNGTALQIGLVTDEAGCEQLARGLLRMGPTDGKLSHADIVDAFGEMANMLAGAVKRRMIHHDSSAKLGLPMVIQGRVEVGEHQESATAGVRMGAIDANIIILRNR